MNERDEHRQGWNACVCGKPFDATRSLVWQAAWHEANQDSDTRQRRVDEQTNGELE